MDFKALQDEVSDLLNFNSTQVDQDFSTAQIKKAINRAYAREYRKARQEGLRSWFIGYTEVSWPGSSATLSLGKNIRRTQITKIMDITKDDPGHILVFDAGGLIGDVFWKDRNTLQWGEEGPGEDKTLRIEYFPEPEEMSADEDEAELLGPAHHELVFYSAAVDLKTRADEVAPQAWVFELENLRLDLYKDVSRGRPHSNISTIGNTYPDAVDYVY